MNSNADQLVYTILKTYWDTEARADVGRLLDRITDWDTFFKKIIRERINGLIYQRLKNMNFFEIIPVNVSQRIFYEYCSVMSRNGYIMQELDNILKSGIPCMVIKGCALCKTIPELKNSRVMDDVDLVIDKEYFPQIKDIFASAGYKVDPEYENLFITARDGGSRPADRACLCRDMSAINSFRNKILRSFAAEYFIKPNKIVFDIHMDLFSLPRIESLRYFVKADMSEIRKQSLSYDETHTFAKIPSHIDHVLLLAYHIQKHRFLFLSAFMDIGLLLNNSGIDWDELLERAERYNLGSPLRITLNFLSQRLGFPIPCWVEEFNSGRIERMVAAKLKKGEKIGRVGAFLPVISIKGLFKKIKFSIEIIFPKNVIAQLTGIRKPSLRWYAYILRFFQVIRYALGFH